MRSMSVPLFDFKHVGSATKLIKLKVPFSSDKFLDESGVGLIVFIFKSPAKSKLWYIFKAFRASLKFSQKTQISKNLEDNKWNKMHQVFLTILISMQKVSAFSVSNFGILFAIKPSLK